MVAYGRVLECFHHLSMAGALAQGTGKRKSGANGDGRLPAGEDPCGCLGENFGG